MTREYVVRVAWKQEKEHTANHDCIGLFLEQLRYAGMVRMHMETDQYIFFDMLPPAGVDSAKWAEQNAKRMSSFGLNAVKAPKWVTQLRWIRSSPGSYAKTL